MNVFAEVYISSTKGTKYIFSALQKYSSENLDWIYDKKRSASYSSNLIDCVGCVMLFNKSKWKPGISICEEKNGKCRISNITPKRSGKIPTSEYNKIAQEFHDQLKQWNRRNKQGLRIIISKTDLELDDIITAKIPHKLFRSFLNNYPFSYHPNDISRLDKFICSVSRYSCKKIYWEYLGEYLREKEKWPEENIDWCLNRIRIGLEIISEYKKFH